MTTPPICPVCGAYMKQLRRGAPLDHGCHGYDRGGVMFTRCADHKPAGSRDCGPVRGACPECARVTQ